MTVPPAELAFAAAHTGQGSRHQDSFGEHVVDHGVTVLTSD